MKNQEDTRLTILKPAGDRYLCRCVCGVEKMILRRHVNSGRIKSCGCLRRDNKPSLTHGKTYDPEYKVWEAMKRRCLSNKCSAYPDYGGRGIKVCERWIHSFENFISDMGKRPSNLYCIERKENNGNYEPGNCKWATRKEEARNTRRNHLIEIKGETKSLAEWVEIYQMPYGAVKLRIRRRKWSPERALTEPVRITRRSS